MKAFLLFGGNDYDALGGWRDFHGDFDDIPPAETHAETHSDEMCNMEGEYSAWAHIIDRSTGKVVRAGSKLAYSHDWKWSNSACWESE